MLAHPKSTMYDQHAKAFGFGPRDFAKKGISTP